MFLEKITKALNEYKVQFVLVGGYAVALHGAVRGTVDIDLVINLNRSSYKKAEDALHSIGLESRLPISADDVFTFREEYIKNRNLIAWTFYNSKNPIENVDIIITENATQLKSVIKNINGAKIKVVAINDLIMMKKKSGRKQDLEDIKALEKLTSEKSS